MSVRHFSFVESKIYEAYYNVTQCSLVDMYRLFEGTCHRSGGAASFSEPLVHKYQSTRRHSSKAAIFFVMALRTSDLT
jgi:hypothetical protein